MIEKAPPAVRALMVQGTTSDAGKSIITAGLCRALARRGARVAPFKPQNMSLNSAVTVDGGEIGRAQALQAQACGLPPRSDMNPVLLKPCSDTGAQVILKGRAVAQCEARAYHDYKATAMSAVLDSFHRLSGRYEYLVVEGAGSPAEINLRDNDIANMGFAEAVDCPVILVADIDRGGVFAHLVGTLQLLSASEQQRVAGFVINRFRGDIALLQPGIEWLEEYTGKPVLGVVPFLHGLYLDAEDAVAVQQEHAAGARRLRVVVPVLPRVSNHTDFDGLRLHPDVDLQFVGPGQRIPGADLIVLPGSKNVRADLHWLRERGWEAELQRHLRYGGKVLGICGGFQMLGRAINDPQGLEDTAGMSTGLGLLDMETVLEEKKILANVRGTLVLNECVNQGLGGTPVVGYEIHCGRSRGAALSRNAITLSDGRPDGAVSADEQVVGTYLHGLFDHPAARDALLAWSGLQVVAQPAVAAVREQQLERLTDTLEDALDLARLFPEIHW